MRSHRHVFTSTLLYEPVVLQGIQFYLLECECGKVCGYGGLIVRPEEARIFGHYDSAETKELLRCEYSVHRRSKTDVATN